MPTASIITTCGLCALGAYVLGATPFGYLAGRLRGIDIREHGSGNIGATNVVRVLGKGIGLPVFALDALKGWLPVWLAGWWAHTRHGDVGSVIAAAQVCAALGAVLGHNFTFWLGGKGGKGVATSAGVVAGLMPLALLGALVVWAVVFFSTRFVSLASILAAVALPLACLGADALEGRQRWLQFGLATVMAALTIYRHRSDIARLRAGTEPKAGARKSPSPEEVQS